MARSKVNPLNPPKSGTFDKPLTLDLRPVLTVKKFKGEYPLSLRRLLGSINAGVKPNGEGGILGNISENVDISINTSIKVLETLSNTPPHMAGVGLLDIEKDNFSKIVDASGFRPMAHFMDDKYPWLITNGIDKDYAATFLETCSQIGLLLKRISKMAGLPDPGIYVPSNLHSGKYQIAYRKGSSYGVFPYVPGTSKLSGVALAYHGLSACVLSHAVSKGAKVDINSATDILMDKVGSMCYTYDPLAIMMIRRARPLGPNKKVPLWSKTKTPGVYEATAWESGVCSGTREIKAINASLNMTTTGMAQYFAATVGLIPGLHVGHLIQSPDVLRRAVDSWGLANTDVHVEDISGYDNSVGPEHTEGFYNILRGLFNIGEADLSLLKVVDSCPIMTSGLADGKDEYSLLKRTYGISSGDQLTTARGTLINTACKITSYIKQKKVSFSDAIEKCMNFRLALGLSTGACDWGFLLKGDDVVVFSKKSSTTADVFKIGMAKLGFKTDVEPGPIFLMNYIKLTGPITGNEYPYCPKKFLDYKSFKSHGLGCKRLGNRTIFVEHPLRDIRPARFAIASNIRDMWFHPCRDMINTGMIEILNNAEERNGGEYKWTEDNLLRYTTGPKGVSDMQEFAKDTGSGDPFSRELLRRSSWGSGSRISMGDFDDVEGSDNDGLGFEDNIEAMDPGLALMVKSLAEFSVPGFGTSAVGEEIKKNTGVDFSDDADALVMHSKSFNLTTVENERLKILKMLQTN